MSALAGPPLGGLERRGPGFGQEGDDARFRAQIAHLYDHSPFYQRHLRQAGFGSAADVGGLFGIADLPFTEKDDLRRTRSHAAPVGDHLAVPMSEVTRLYATAGYSGMPSFVPLTRRDLAAWVEIATRCYGAAGLKPGEKILSSFASGPYAGAAALEAFAELGLCYIPSPGADLDRTIAMLQMLRPEILTATPSGALRLAELACAHGMDPRGFGLRRLVLSGEAGGGEAALRARLEAIWGAEVSETMGLGDIAVALWGDCGARAGMHFWGGGHVHVELVDPEGSEVRAPVPGAEGELVYTHLGHRAAPLLRFRSGDLVQVVEGGCACGRTGPRIRCIGRVGEVLTMRGRRILPGRLRDLMLRAAPELNGHLQIRPARRGSEQSGPLPVAAELGAGIAQRRGLADRLAREVHQAMDVPVEVTLLEAGSLPRNGGKFRLVDWSRAHSERRIR